MAALFVLESIPWQEIVLNTPVQVVAERVNLHRTIPTVAARDSVLWWDHL